jgi:hypothetical protein
MNAHKHKHFMIHKIIKVTKKIYFLIFFFLLFISCNSERKKIAQQNTLKFQDSEVNGVITDFFTSINGAQIKVDNDYRKFKFSCNKNSNSKSLMNAVEIGDSLIKMPKSKFFTIKKRNDTTYTYSLNMDFPY